MVRRCSIVFAAAVVFGSALVPAAFAEHGDRPANLPPLGSANLTFVDGAGLVRGFERGSPGAVAILVFGWSFDGNDPNSPFVASSPSDTQVNEAMTFDLWRYAYNGTTFTYSLINEDAINKNPNADLGSGRIAMFDDSKLTVTNSILKTDVIGAGDRSKVQISDTRLVGELQMRSTGAMTLSGVTPFQQVSQAGDLRLFAERGITTISFSTLDSVTTRDQASVAVMNSTIRGRVSHDRGALDPSQVPTTTLTDTKVESLLATIGTVRMTGGEVTGAMTASGDASDASRAGKIFTDGVMVGGSVSATRNATVTMVATRINGNVTVGDSTKAFANVRLASSDVVGTVQAVGQGILDINGFEFIGTGGGTAVKASGGVIEIANGRSISGHVFAVGKGGVFIRNVRAVDGDAFADETAFLSLRNTSARNVGAFTDSTLLMSRASADSVLVDRGTADLDGVTIANGISVFGKGRLSFGGGSTVGGSISNFGDSTGLVQVTSGSVGGDLVGFGSSITAMSGGHVEGSPVFRDQATFLYSGGTFGFAGVLFPSSGSERVASRQGDVDIAASDAPFSASSGFTALGDATIKIIGFHLQATLLDPDYVQDDLSFSVYQLTGLLADNSSIDGGLVFIQNDAGTASFALIEAPPVPEPSVTALFILGLSCLGFARRARRSMQTDRLVKGCHRQLGLSRSRSPEACTAWLG